jgi:hypothetical protein
MNISFLGISFSYCEGIRRSTILLANHRFYFVLSVCPMASRQDSSTVHILITAHPDDESLFFLPRIPGPRVGESCCTSPASNHAFVVSIIWGNHFRIPVMVIATLAVNSFTLPVLLFSHFMFHEPHVRDPRSNQMKFTCQAHNGPSICYTHKNYHRCMSSTYCT